ncbi:hypothetical protein ARMGADRAFT_936772, partial [Armillaria gallica]
ERLAVDSNSNNILFFGAKSGNGLYKSTDYGSTWIQVSSLPDIGYYFLDFADVSDYDNRAHRPAAGIFDSTLGPSSSPTPRVFVGVASNGTDNIFISEDASYTCKFLNLQYAPNLTDSLEGMAVA